MNHEKKILIYGLNRSGTNYLQELMQNKLNVCFINKEDDRSHPMHKHFRLYNNKQLIGRPNFLNKLLFNSFSEFENHHLMDERPKAYIIISKDPYSWNLSYSNWGKKNNWEPCPHPFIMEYNEFYKKWLEFSKESDKILFVRYSDLLNNEEDSIKQIARKLNLSLINGGAKNKIRKVPMSHRFTSKRLKYYLNMEYLSDYSSQELSELNKYIDTEIIHQLGYQLHVRS